MVPATIEPKRTPIRARLALTPVGKASSVMKSDMVKPIPPRPATPKICRKLILSGSRAIPERTASQAKSVMPRGLPMTRPGGDSPHDRAARGIAQPGAEGDARVGEGEDR